MIRRSGVQAFRRSGSDKDGPNISLVEPERLNARTPERLMQSVRALIAGAVLLALVAPARAEHFGIDLTVKTPHGQEEAHWDTSPPVGGVNPRPVVTAKVGDRIDIDWLMRSEFPHGVLKDATVHFFVVREAALGQKPVPDLKSGKWVESRMVMDFLPDHAARGSMQLTAREPGFYLVRVESQGTEKEVAHEHFSAIDLKVE
jgi:hypothetical protein